MPPGPSNPVRVLAIAMVALQFVVFLQGLGLHVLDRLPPEVGETYLIFAGGVSAATPVLHAVLFIGLVLGCDRRFAPAVALAAWFAISPVTHAPMWSPEPQIVTHALWLAADATRVGVIASVAFVQSDRGGLVAGAGVAEFVLLGLTFALRLAGGDTLGVDLGLSILHTLLISAGYMVLAIAARPAERKHSGWPLVLLGMLPMLRVWMALNAGLLARSYDLPSSRAALLVMAQVGRTEVALFALFVIAFVGVSRRGTDAVPVVVGLALHAALWVATGVFLSWVASSSWEWQREFGRLVWPLVGATGLSGIVVLFLQIRTLRALALHLRADRLVSRADATTGAYGLVIGLAVIVVGGRFVLPSRDPLVAVMWVALGGGILLGSLFAVGLWTVLCFGLAQRLDQERPYEDSDDADQVWG